MNNNFIEFIKSNLGFIIGLLIGILVVILRIGYFFVNLAIMIAFGLLGAYVQKNKLKVKAVLQNLIDKI